MVDMKWPPPEPPKRPRPKGAEIIISAPRAEYGSAWPGIIAIVGAAIVLFLWSVAAAEFHAAMEVQAALEACGCAEVVP